MALLHYVHGLPPGEIAHLRSEPPSTVRSTLHRARGLLRGVLVATPALALLGAPSPGLAAIREVVAEEHVLGVPYSVPSDKWDELRVLASLIQYPTINGLLEVAIYAPIDARTTRAFLELLEDNGNDVIQTSTPKISPFDS